MSPRRTNRRKSGRGNRSAGVPVDFAVTLVTSAPLLGLNTYNIPLTSNNLDPNRSVIFERAAIYGSKVDGSQIPFGAQLTLLQNANLDFEGPYKMCSASTNLLHMNASGLSLQPVPFSAFYTGGVTYLRVLVNEFTATGTPIAFSGRIWLRVLPDTF
jgi:hypothetical protein